MAVDKGKVLAALEIKFKGKSLTKNFKDKIAEKWAAKIETDEEIDAYIEDREDVILEASTEADRRATQAATKARQEAADAAAGKKPETETKAPPTDDLPADTPEWAKAIILEAKAARAEVAELKAARQTETIADRFKKDERLKGIPEFMLKGRIPQKEDDLETAITELVADFKPYAEQNKLAAFGGDAPATGNKQAANGVKEASKEQVAAVLSQL